MLSQCYCMLILFQNKKGRLSRSPGNILLPPLPALPMSLVTVPYPHMSPVDNSIRFTSQALWISCYFESRAPWVAGSMCSILTHGMNLCTLLILRKSHFCMTVLALTCCFRCLCDNSETSRTYYRTSKLRREKKVLEREGSFQES